MKSGKFLNTPQGIFVLTTKSATLALLLFIYRLAKRISNGDFYKSTAIAQKEDKDVCFCGAMSVIAIGANCSK